MKTRREAPERRTVRIERKLDPQQSVRWERVRDAARELASQGGYKAVTMHGVGELAGIARATLYRYFSSKDHMLSEVTQRWAEEIEEDLRVHPPGGRTAAARAAGVYRRVMDAVREDPDLVAACVTAMISPDPVAALSQRRLSGVMARYLVAARRAEDQGDPAVLGMVLGHVLFSALASFTSGRASIDEVSAELELAAHTILD